MGVWSAGPGPTDGDDASTDDGTNETAGGGNGNYTLIGAGGDNALFEGGAMRQAALATA